MRVLLDTTYALRGPSGTGVYLAQLTRALRDEGVEVIEAANDQRPAPAGGGAGSARNLALDLRWTQVELPRRAARHKPTSCTTRCPPSRRARRALRS